MDLCREIYKLSATLSQSEIASCLAIKRSRVQYWIARKGIRCESRPGRRKSTDQLTDQRIIEIVIQNPSLSASDIQKQFFPDINIVTLRRRIRNAGFRRQIQGSKMVLNNDDLRERFNFAKAYSHYSVEDWMNVFFTTKKTFEAGSFRISVFMGFSGHASAILLIKPTPLKSKEYIQEIMSSILPNLGGEIQFQQTQSTFNTSKLTLSWLEKNNVKLLNLWPMKSKDINPVENAYLELRNSLKSYPSPRNSTDLWRIVEKEFTAFNVLRINYFFNQMPVRINALITEKGNHIQPRIHFVPNYGSFEAKNDDLRGRDPLELFDFNPT